MHNLRGIDELLAAALGGDKQAENQLFSQLRVRILALVQQRIWNTNRHESEIMKDAEDLTNDILRIILQKYKTASFDYGFMPWVNKIVWFKIGEYFRNRKIKERIEVSKVQIEELHVATDPNCTEELIESQELDEMSIRAMKKLDRGYQAIIEALLQGKIKSYIEKQKKKKQIGAIYVDIHRCRERFIDLLGEEGFER
ncbi:MAG: RNA polymerase sigma factor [bacterium]